MEEIKQQYNSTASTRTGPGLKGWEPLFKQKMIQTWEPAPRLFDAGWQDYLNKKEDKDPSFLLFVVFISVLHGVNYNSTTVTVPRLFLMIAVGSIPFVFFGGGGYSICVQLQDVHMFWKCRCPLQYKKKEPQPPKFHRNQFLTWIRARSTRYASLVFLLFSLSGRKQNGFLEPTVTHDPCGLSISDWTGFGGLKNKIRWEQNGF